MVVDEIGKAPNSRMTRHIERSTYIAMFFFWLSLLRSESKDNFFRGLVLLLLLLDPASVIVLLPTVRLFWRTVCSDWNTFRSERRHAFST